MKTQQISLNADPLTATMRRIIHFYQCTKAEIVEEMRERAARRHLRTLDDRTLRDIGLTRADTLRDTRELGTERDALANRTVRVKPVQQPSSAVTRVTVDETGREEIAAWARQATLGSGFAASEAVNAND